ncbi:GNAT family N-acetyltransferase [Kitasatospora cineracea]|uniref:RimJ/RimL family protein N-acetyltransferase n=1 Tax=Kitasatospora cineracea TaxID=88074 RepID=A0A8G1UK22_9ACTN|nr:GNAT family N-acetyltransferase [Kitasatospora cineracea]ROR45461.1 RimJ/RimL family protein N-acetyltransferase [Kitasatospora cineracea]
MPTAPTAVVLEGRLVRLEPLTAAHVPALFEAGGRDEEVWRHLSAPTPQTEDDLHAIVAARLADAARGHRLPLAVLDRARGRAIGTTNLHGWDTATGRIEIGGTWFGRRWWRTGANRETKLLLMAHAFDTLGFTEIRWRVDAANTRSRRAVTRLGARPADSAAPPHGLLHYTLTATDWPAARARLTTR